MFSAYLRYLDKKECLDFLRYLRKIESIKKPSLKNKVSNRESHTFEFMFDTSYNDANNYGPCDRIGHIISKLEHNLTQYSSLVREGKHYEYAIGHLGTCLGELFGILRFMSRTNSRNNDELIYTTFKPLLAFCKKISKVLRESHYHDSHPKLDFSRLIGRLVSIANSSSNQQVKEYIIRIIREHLEK
jgi:hypothetical protein